MIRERFLIQKNRFKATTTIVYFHGIFSTAHSCRPLEELAEHFNYDFLAYTMPMHGNNHLKQQDDLSLANIHNMIKEIIKKVKTPKIILASHSAGANWVAESIRIFGQESFDKIILISPINSSLRVVSKNKIKTIKQLVTEKRSFHQIFTDLSDANVFFYDFQAIEKYRYLDFLKAITSKELLQSNDEIFANVRIPTLIILGKNDIVIDPDRTFDLFTFVNPEFKIRVLDGGHSPHDDQKQVFNEIVSNFFEQ